MTKEEFEKMSAGLRTDICHEIAYEYVVFVPKDEEKAISKFNSLVRRSDKKFLEKNVLEEANDKPIFPYHIVTGKIDQMVEGYYKEFTLGLNTKGLLTQYGSRGEAFFTYFSNCLKDSENTTKDVVKQELFRRLSTKNDAKSAIKAVGDVIDGRTRSFDKLLQSLSKQMEQSIDLWEHQDQGFTKYRVHAGEESCDVCQSMQSEIFDISDAAFGEDLPPFHPNCDCTIEILDERENVVHTQEKTEPDEEGWGKYIASSLKQLVLGNFTDDATLLGTALQVLAGIVGVDWPLDVRDLLYDVTNFEFTKEHIGQTLLDAVAFLPIIGGVKFADEAADVVKAGAKYADEAADALKSADKIADAAKAVEKTNPFADLPKHLNMGDQGKHMIGHNNYQPERNRSILTISPELAEELIRKFSGTGRYINDTKESVDFGRIIGKYVVYETGEAYDTTVGTIHYSRKKGVHIVPGKPNNWEE